MSQLPILIIGGTSKTGARVNALLQAQGVATRAVSRSTATPFDWNQPRTWPAALDGVASELSGLARARGLQRLVLLSGRGEPGAQRAEAALQAAGVPWTIVRASWFNQNFSEGYLLDGVRAGEIALPVGEVLEPFIDADDIADVVAAALNDERHANQLYEVTGPRALTFAEAVAGISAAAGRPIRYRQVSPEAFAAGMRPFVPEEIIDLMDELFSVVLDGRNSAVAHGVEAALGRRARDFCDYARNTAANGVWRA